jgi:hypothetical protein
MIGLDHITVSASALAETNERLFPPSRHRSARIRKKLIKRFGGEFRMKPAAFQLAGGRFVVHPEIYRQLEREVRRRLWSGHDGATL